MKRFTTPHASSSSPTYAGRSGRSVRIIGYAPSIDRILSVLIVVDGGHEYGASSWPANEKDRNIYPEGARR